MSNDSNPTHPPTTITPRHQTPDTFHFRRAQHVAASGKKKKTHRGSQRTEASASHAHAPPRTGTVAQNHIPHHSGRSPRPCHIRRDTVNRLCWMRDDMSSLLAQAQDVHANAKRGRGRAGRWTGAMCDVPRGHLAAT
eukprot:scaffold7706_cov138-Isochrysis_galbana.AAC.5